MEPTVEQQIQTFIENEKYDAGISLLGEWVKKQFNSQNYIQELNDIDAKYQELKKFSLFQQGIIKSFFKIESLIDTDKKEEYEVLSNALNMDVVELYSSQSLLAKISIRDRVLHLLRKIRADLDKILFVYSAPIDVPLLNFEKEYFLIDKALRDKNVTLILPDIKTEFDFKIETIRHSPKVIHFVGHGAVSFDTMTGRSAGIRPSTPQETTGIYLVDENNNKAKLVPPETLNLIIKKTSSENPNLEVVFLNCCGSAEYAKYISKNNLYVIAIDGEIEDEKAISFSYDFYSFWLASNKNIEHSFKLAKDFNAKIENIVMLFHDGEVIL